MELMPLVGPVLTAVITAGGVYAAITNRLTRLETLIEQLKSETEKHNQVVERTFKLESDVSNLYHRYGELREEMKGE